MLCSRRLATIANAAPATRQQFVPESGAISEAALAKFRRIFARIDRLVVLTGAGISTESGIPDYRSKLTGRHQKNGPITHQEFMSSEWWRRRYWARNFLAWPRFGGAQCNETHTILADWERQNPNRFQWLITQNVDALHSRAGSERVTELHGCGRTVRCMDCGTKYERELVQSWMEAANAGWTGCAEKGGELRPDGDAEVSEQALHSFSTPHCPKCGPESILKTDVVFFGDNVPMAAVKHCFEMVTESSGLLVLGSSLTVMSGYRFVAQAQMLELPILIVNIGSTRADQIASAKLEAKCSEVLRQLEWK